ncbi:MAG TPA: electron transport complex subunit RsxC [Bacteroidales bacterium]|nr:electron transport complex subunit RsxC [Bacteroidales bacterium]HNS46449.1 electron transport complex subunit RsxC [Bacteroidales bacterium]
MLKTFKLGGVHPAENKLSASQPIREIPLPKRVFVTVSQNLGAPSRVIVQNGDRVKTGQLIAKGESFISSNIHSPVSGKVFKVDEVLDISGYRKQAILIDVEGDEWEDSIDRTDGINWEVSLSPKEIIDRISQMGIVGMGGATFPAHVKLMVPEGKKVDTLIINGVECEPYLTADHRLMLEKGKEVLMGAFILMRALKVERVIIGIEQNKSDAIAHLSDLSNKFPGFQVQGLKVKYPQGGEKQLIKALLNREVPSGKLPFEVGCVVHNVGTAFAVYEAVQKNKPLFERVVTVTGKTLKNPSNFLARIGTPISELLEQAGGFPENAGKILSGGPMMGKALISFDTPVVKGMSGIVLLPEEESVRVKVQNCIRCSRCVSVCPMGLEPYLLALRVAAEDFEGSEKDRVMDCIECGSCHYTCPSGRPLLDYIRVGKIRVGQIIRNRGKK